MPRQKNPNRIPRRKRTDLPNCNVEGCKSIAKGARGMCLSHYHGYLQDKHREQVARGERTPILIPDKLTTRSDGYVLGYAPDHPLAMQTGYVLEHRRIAFNKYGPDDQPCNWCQEVLPWKAVQVDHLDWDRGNNDPDNLVPSCKDCNIGRKSPREEQANQNSQKMRDLIRRFRED